MDSGLILNYIMSLLLKKVVVPADFKEQSEVIKTMLTDDISGLVDSLTDFSVQSASVNYTIESTNDAFSKTMKMWLDTINREYNGKIPMGVNSLAKEYFQERWKGASFPVLKIAKWGKIDGIMLPTRMFFVDGGSITALDKTKEDELNLLSYNYYLGKEKNAPILEGDNVIFARPFGRWFDKYPVPYLIKRGVYHNFKILQSLKNKESDILDQVIPYLLLVKKGTEGLATSGTKVYTNDELTGIIAEFQSLVDEMKTISPNDRSVKTPVRATNFDEDIKHLIPDLSTIFDTKLFAQAETNILAGLGFIDIAEAVSNSRKESVLNPKVFIAEVNAGVEDFKKILYQIIELVKVKNGDHTKYMNADFIVASSPVKSFMSEEFKTRIREAFDRGKVSTQTYIELVPEADLETELYRRQKEAKRGIEYTMYPQIITNQEGKGIDVPEDKKSPEKLTKDNVSPDKKGIEKNNYANAGIVNEDLIGSPYRKIADLPDAVKKHFNLKKQRAWMDIFNSAINFYLGKGLDMKAAEQRAFSTAWTKIKKVK